MGLSAMVDVDVDVDVGVDVDQMRMYRMRYRYVCTGIRYVQSGGFSAVWCFCVVISYC